MIKDHKYFKMIKICFFIILLIIASTSVSCKKKEQERVLPVERIPEVSAGEEKTAEEVKMNTEAKESVKMRDIQSKEKKYTFLGWNNNPVLPSDFRLGEVVNRRNLSLKDSSCLRTSLNYLKKLNKSPEERLVLTDPDSLYSVEASLSLIKEVTGNTYRFFPVVKSDEFNIVLCRILSAGMASDSWLAEIYLSPDFLITGLQLYRDTLDYGENYHPDDFIMNMKNSF